MGENHLRFSEMYILVDHMILWDGVSTRAINRNRTIFRVRLIIGKNYMRFSEITFLGK